MQLSIIVLVYNHENYLVEALNSINRQKFEFNVEVLIGNDASSDGTLDILNKYKFNKYIDCKIINREKNIGATNNLYDLILRCTGEYIAILEGDDFWNYNDKILRQIDFLEQNKKYVACYTNVHLVDENSNRIDDREYNIGFIETEYKLENFEKLELPGQTGSILMKNPKKIINTTIIKNIITYDNLIGDRGICFILLLMGEIYKINDKMSSYRVQTSGNNFTSITLNKNNYYRLLKIYKNMKQESKKINNIAISESCDICMSKLCMAAGIYCIKNFNKVNIKIFMKCLNNVNIFNVLKICINKLVN